MTAFGLTGAPCSGCGLRDCRCDDDPRDDCPVCRELPEERAAYVPSPEYAAWCAEVDLRRGIERDLRFTMEQQRRVA